MNELLDLRHYFYLFIYFVCLIIYLFILLYQLYWTHQNKYKEQNRNTRNKMTGPEGIVQKGTTRSMLGATPETSLKRILKNI